MLFAALSLFVIMRSGDQIDMGGEKHGIDAHEAVPAASVPAVAGSAASAP